MRLVVLILLLLGISICYRNTMLNKRYDFIHERETIEQLQQQKGVVRNIGTEQLPVYVIYCEQYHVNLFPYNLPDHFHQQNIPVVFSGNLKKMHPLEDEYGQYFEVVKMQPGAK